MKLANKDWLDVPVITLLAANAVPLFGVLFLGWDAFYVVLLYWAENVVMHVAILAGGFFVMALGSPTVFLVVLIILKTILDINLHNREHKKATARRPVSTG